MPLPCHGVSARAGRDSIGRRKATISVCMATYNGEPFIQEQLDSILCQLGAGDELIISDDGSTDRTVEIIESYNDNRIRLLHHAQRPEYASIRHSRNFYYATDNFENALQAARGDYIFLADQDDVWLEGKVQRMLHELNRTNLVMSNFNICDEKGNVVHCDFHARNPISSSVALNIIRSRFIGCCMAFSKETLDKALPFPKKLLAHDFWIGLVASSLAAPHFIPESYINYRRTGNNVSCSTEKSTNTLAFKLYYRLRIALQLCRHSLQAASRSRP